MQKRILAAGYHSISRASIWIAAALSAFLAVGYSKLTSYIQIVYSSFIQGHFYLGLAATPLLFVIATLLVEKLAPDAKGSGIPQVIRAIEQAETESYSGNCWLSSLISIKTAFIKVISSSIGLMGGASIGREGPTVQISASVFAWTGKLTQRYFSDVDFGSYLTAGAAAGVAAAFNTPLAGITFALEEVATGTFLHFKNIIIIGVVIAGITAQALVGDYLYFTHLTISEPKLIVIPEAILLGVLGGLLGGIFARLLTMRDFIRPTIKGWQKALICGLACTGIAYLTNGDSTGSGYEITKRAFAESTPEHVSLAFPFLKMLATVFSYLSGMAGGIFSPSLSVGGALGIVVAKIFHFVNFKTCSLLGMVAFFGGAIQAPLTAVVIVMEMTDERSLLLVFMIAAYISQAIGKKMMPVPLYKYLAMHYHQGSSETQAKPAIQNDHGCDLPNAATPPP